MNEMKVTQEGNILIVENRHGLYRFELVNEVPPGYEVWKIGDNMAPGYLPFCRLCATQPFEGVRNIEVDTLKAIKIDGAEKALKAAHYGKTVAEMEKYVMRFAGVDDEDVQHKVRIFAAAIPVMKRIKWKKNDQAPSGEVAVIHRYDEASEFNEEHFKEVERRMKIRKLATAIEEYTENLSARDIHRADFAEKFAAFLLDNGVV